VGDSIRSNLWTWTSYVAVFCKICTRVSNSVAYVEGEDCPGQQSGGAAKMEKWDDSGKMVVIRRQQAFHDFRGWKLQSAPGADSPRYAFDQTSRFVEFNCFDAFCEVEYAKVPALQSAVCVNKCK